MSRLFAAVLILAAVFCTAPVYATSNVRADNAEQAIERGLEYLRQHQNPDGSWTPQPGPAVTAMILTVLLERPNANTTDPTVTKALAYVLSKVREDGGIHDGFLENYNTAISLSALSRLSSRKDIAPVVRKAQSYLRDLQWSSQVDPAGTAVTKDHRFFGGAGYGEHGRPDLSNTQTMVQGLHDSGLDCNDAAYQRAMVFITRCQGTAANTAFGDKIVADGGFIYATSTDKEHLEQLETKVGTGKQDPPEAKAGGVSGGGPPPPAEPVEVDAQGKSRLRTYGSMTYAGFKSYLYANLDRKDPRVQDAFVWIQKHYTVNENPGVGQQGFYYYLLTFSRALSAWGSPTIKTADGKEHDWGNDLIDKLVTNQRENGSWINPSDRWMEGDANLVTAYALLALTEAVK